MSQFGPKSGHAFPNFFIDRKSFNVINLWNNQEGGDRGFFLENAARAATQAPSFPSFAALSDFSGQHHSGFFGGYRACPDGKHLTERGRQALDKVPEGALAAPGPGPAARAERQEWWTMFSRANPRLGGLVQMLREGYSKREIAEALGITERQVRRPIQGLHEGALALDGFPF